MNLQNELRTEVKKLKWQEGISYKVIAEDLLELKYNSFINWLHGYKNLSSKRLKLLKEFIDTMK